MNCNKKQNALRILFTLLSVLIILFIFLQSIKSGDVSSEQSGIVLKFLNRISYFIGLGELFTHSFVRTCAHFFEFFVLGISLFLTYKTYWKKTPIHLITSLFTAALVALTDEIIQLYTDGRAFQIIDILIDISGASLSIVLMFILFNLRNHKTNKGEKRCQK